MQPQLHVKKDLAASATLQGGDSQKRWVMYPPTCPDKLKRGLCLRTKSTQTLWHTAGLHSQGQSCHSRREPVDLDGRLGLNPGNVGRH